MKVKIAVTIGVILLAVLSYIGKEGYLAAKAYEKSSRTISSMLDTENIAEFKLKELASILTLGMVENDSKEKLLNALKEKKRDKNRAESFILYYSAAAFAILCLYWFVGIRAYTFFLSFAALVSLVNGIVTPIMMVTVHKNVEFVGDVVFSFESRAITGSILKLFEQGNLLVAGVILLFSVLLPVMKTASLLFLSLYEQRPFAATIVGFFKRIGKWSMLDVFVVAILLVYLGSGNSDVSRAEAEIGIYFFMIYVVLSVAASLTAERMLTDMRRREAGSAETLPPPSGEIRPK